MRSTVVRLVIAVAMAIGIGMPPAFGGTAPSDCTTIKATLSEYKIKLTKKSVAAGCVALKVVNRGVEDHEVIVTKAKRPRDLHQDAGVVDEAEVDVIAETGDLATGKRSTLELELTPGRYVLFCNVLHEESEESDGGHAHEEETKSDSHFGEGMHKVLTVR
jgi:hypothetical protein